eukprot:CAMPEP_0181220062 /NCGR_PEP_ID=MMETSP1096-20121128/28632_1 /TAXON_ID=156174 ORGANISM="Chrysochromulina ericina, Strain CCMP281" /NCGR_SAMPLE_ID=MMETSP1096 /ASSEMBLY_ACC=CAM_ASM_000453 /LENGTH=112 /DNA_ID=CAMNT_0023312531 /DNA_START=269 /DNA_END=607 /DNA_ORIENTATION=-
MAAVHGSLSAGAMGSSGQQSGLRARATHNRGMRFVSSGSLCERLGPKDLRILSHRTRLPVKQLTSSPWVHLERRLSLNYAHTHLGDARWAIWAYFEHITRPCTVRRQAHACS